MLVSHHKWPRLLLKCISDKLESDLDSPFHYLTSLGILGLNLLLTWGGVYRRESLMSAIALAEVAA